MKHYLHYLTLLVTASSIFLHRDCLPNRKFISIMCILGICVSVYVCFCMRVHECFELYFVACVCVCLFGLCEIFTLERSVVFRMSLSLSLSRPSAFFFRMFMSLSSVSFGCLLICRSVCLVREKEENIASILPIQF